MGDQWVLAYQSVQEKYEKLRNNGRLNYYLVERFDGALDYLARNPHLTGDPGDLAWRAWRAAGKKLRREKKRRVQFVSPEGLDVDGDRKAASDAAEDPLFEVVILYDFINSAKLRLAEIQILRDLAARKSSRDISERLGITVRQAQVRISHTRRKAWTQWLAA